jgi:trigger factor
VKTTVEELEDNKVKLSVEVEAEVFEAEVEKAFKKIGRDVRLPGFRKGKVPRKVLEARFGSGMARGQALEDSIPDYFLQALGEHEIDMISPPEYDVTGGLEEGNLAFDAVVAVRPAVEIDGYDPMTIEIPAPTPTDEEIQERVDSFLGQFGELASVERAAEDGDTVTMDIATTQNGEEVEGLTASDYSYKVGSGGLVPELDENLAGASIGDTVTFDADHPDPEEEDKLAFSIEIKDIQEQVLPELDDEVVSNATDFETADEWRADLVEQMTKAKAVHSNNLWREKAAEALGALVTDDPPAPLVDTEVRNRVEDMARRLQQSGIPFDQYMQMTGQSVEDLFEQMREPAVDSVKVDQALRALATAEGLNATDDDLDAEFADLAEGTGLPIEDLKTQISTKNQLMLMKADISKRNAVDWLLERVVVVDEDGNTIDKDALEEASQPDEDDQDHAHDHAPGDEEE